jgi:hypothetical protein
VQQRRLADTAFAAHDEHALLSAARQRRVEAGKLARPPHELTMARNIQQVAKLSGHRTTVAPQRPPDKLEEGD